MIFVVCAVLFVFVVVPLTDRVRRFLVAQEEFRTLIASEGLVTSTFFIGVTWPLVEVLSLGWVAILLFDAFAAGCGLVLLMAMVGFKFRSGRHWMPEGVSSKAVVVELLIIVVSIGLCAGAAVSALHRIESRGIQATARETMHAVLGEVWSLAVGAFGLVVVLGVIAGCVSLLVREAEGRPLIAPSGVLVLAGIVTGVGFFPHAPLDGLNRVLSLLLAVIGLSIAMTLLVRTLNPHWMMAYSADASATAMVRRVVETALVISSATMGFAYFTAFLISINLVAPAPALDTFTLARALERSLFVFYAWNFSDQVPILEIPERLEWTEPYRLAPWWGGLLVLSYKVLVAIPVVQLCRATFRATRVRQRAIDRSASDQH